MKGHEPGKANNTSVTKEAKSLKIEEQLAKIMHMVRMNSQLVLL